MAVITPVVPGLAQVIAPTVLTTADTIPVQTGGRYLLVTRNTTATSLATTVDDPNSIPPAGAKTFDPDILITTPITTGVRATVLDANRFRDVNGNINISNVGFAAGTTGEVHGPF